MDGDGLVRRAEFCSGGNIFCKLATGPGDITAGVTMEDTAIIPLGHIIVEELFTVHGGIMSLLLGIMAG